MCEYYGYYLSNNDLSYKSFLQNNNKMNGIIPTWLQVDREGKLIKSAGHNEIKKIINIRDITVNPLIQNYKLKSLESNQILINKDRWLFFVKQLEKFLYKYNIKQFNLNLEGIEGKYKNIFTEFVAYLINRFTAAGIKVSLSIPAKTENHSNSSWTTAYDYHKLGILAEKIFIMAYDYHWAGGSPGPVAPLFWVKDVIDYAIMKIPVHKLYLGIPFYGYDWEVNEDKKRARGLSFSQVMNIKDKYNVKVEWDQDSQTPYIKYNNHEVWFENVTSIIKKVELVKQYNIKGASFWRLGLEPTELWDKI